LSEQLKHFEQQRQDLLTSSQQISLQNLTLIEKQKALERDNHSLQQLSASHQQQLAQQ